MFGMSSRLRGFDVTTVWQEFSSLAVKYKAVNLGQGFPDWESPEFAKRFCIQAINDNFNQYCRSAGETHLIKAVADHYGSLFNREIDPINEICTAVGATEALYAVMVSFLEIGDEVIVLEPTFDVYPAQIQMAGGKCIYVPLAPPTEGENEWRLNPADIEAAITNNTRLVLLNTPHNPTGKVLTAGELAQISEIILKYPRIIVVTDEVYENLIFDGHIHTRIATLPQMWDRTITVTSSGKTFSVTGWKVGWAIAPHHLIQPLVYTIQWIRFCANTPCQKAISDMISFAGTQTFEEFPNYFDYIRNSFERKMKRLAELAEAAGLEPLLAEGGYFLICNTRNIVVPVKYLEEKGVNGQPITRDWAFCRWLTIDIGVAAIPLSAFYTKDRKHIAANYIRFCTCKLDSTIEEAGIRLLALKSYQIQESSTATATSLIPPPLSTAI